MADTTLSIGTYATTGAGTSCVCAIILCFLYCVPSDPWPKPFWLLKALTIYNLGLTSLHLCLAYHFYHYLSDEIEYFSGIGQDTDADIRWWVWLHAATTLSSALIDTIYAIARGGDDRISCAHLLHLFLIFPVWGLTLDNEASVLTDATIVYFCLWLSLIAASVYSYRLVASWGRCITPGSQLSTGFQVTTFTMLIIHSSIGLYYAIEDSSLPRAIVTGAWLLYFILMTVSTLNLMFKSRSNRCCGSSGVRNETTPAAATV